MTAARLPSFFLFACQWLIWLPPVFSSRVIHYIISFIYLGFAPALRTFLDNISRSWCHEYGGLEKRGYYGAAVRWFLWEWWGFIWVAFFLWFSCYLSATEQNFGISGFLLLIFGFLSWEICCGNVRTHSAYISTTLHYRQWIIRKFSTFPGLSITIIMDAFWGNLLSAFLYCSHTITFVAHAYLLNATYSVLCWHHVGIFRRVWSLWKWDGA